MWPWGLWEGLEDLDVVRVGRALHLHSHGEAISSSSEAALALPTLLPAVFPTLPSK